MEILDPTEEKEEVKTGQSAEQLPEPEEASPEAEIPEKKGFSLLLRGSTQPIPT